MAIVATTSLILLEVVLRLLTWSGSFLGFPLLPLDPAEPVRAGAAVDFGSSYLVFDRDLGWSIGASRKSANGLYESDSRGLRRDPGVPPPAPSQPAWAMAFGDSFTHCDDVRGDQTWEHWLGRDTGRTVLNFGVPGYGVDQSVLSYLRQRHEWHAERVLIGYMADNVGRHLSRYRPYLYPLERVFFAKPRFVVRAGDLALLPQPFGVVQEYSSPDLASRLAALTVEDHWYEPTLYAPQPTDGWRTARVVRTVVARRRLGPDRWRSAYADPAAVDLTVRLLERFVEAVREDARLPLIVFFPERTSVRDALAGRAQIASPVLDALRGRGVPLLDLTPEVTAFVARGGSIDRNFLPHYSSALNQVVARALARATGLGAVTNSSPNAGPE